MRQKQIVTETCWGETAELEGMDLPLGLCRQVFLAHGLVPEPGVFAGREQRWKKMVLRKAQSLNVGTWQTWGREGLVCEAF